MLSQRVTKPASLYRSAVSADGSSQAIGSKAGVATVNSTTVIAASMPSRRKAMRRVKTSEQAG